MEIEKLRSGKEMSKYDATMTLAHASRLLNAAIVVMKTLGWAWRWAEWWVDYNSSWEPLIEPGQKEEEMTKEELRIVDSTRESRCDDARKCRLISLSAALRNRAYDNADGGFNREALHRALVAVLSTKSLSGPLEEFEISFLVEWLGRAYRSKSRLLGYGENKLPIGDAKFCYFMANNAPKNVLGDKPLPGADLVESAVIEEVDDFLQTELMEPDSVIALVTPERTSSRKKGSKTSSGKSKAGKKKEGKDADSDKKAGKKSSQQSSSSKSKKSRKESSSSRTKMDGDEQRESAEAPSSSGRKRHHGRVGDDDDAGGVDTPQASKSKESSMKADKPNVGDEGHEVKAQEDGTTDKVTDSLVDAEQLSSRKRKRTTPCGMLPVKAVAWQGPADKQRSHLTAISAPLLQVLLVRVGRK
jgi:hypothetical protein